MSYSTLQPTVDHFDTEQGYLAYRRIWLNHVYVLSDPICDPACLPKLIDQFLLFKPTASFWQVSETTAQCLAALGFSINVFGTDTMVSREHFQPNRTANGKSSAVSGGRGTDALMQLLTSLRLEKDALFDRIGIDPDAKKRFWKLRRDVEKLEKKLAALRRDSVNSVKEKALDTYLAGSAMEFLRRQYKSAIKAGVSVQEVPPTEWCNYPLCEISQEWISTRMVDSLEMVFFTRPMALEMDRDCGVRLFVAMVDKCVIGFLLIDPIHEQGNIRGYYADILRTRRNAPKGTGYILLLESMAEVFAEGVEAFSLGLSPFHDVRPVRKRDDQISVSEAPSESMTAERLDNPLATWLLRTTFEKGTALYDSKSQAFHKSRFRAPMHATFYCTRRRLPLLEILGAFVASGIKPILQARKILREEIRRCGYICHLLGDHTNIRGDKKVAEDLMPKKIAGHTDAVGKFYDTIQRLYSWFWSSKYLRYGLWEEGTRNISGALENTDRLVESLLELKPGDTVLDAGCGVGTTAIRIAKAHRARVTGINISEVQLAIARKAAGDAELEGFVTFDAQDYTKTTFADDSFTHEFAIESVYHADDPNAFAREAYRVLRGGGGVNWWS